MSTPAAFPASVYAFGAWLLAHPAVVRVKLDAATLDTYQTELDQVARVFGGHPAWHRPMFTWRGRQAAIATNAWHYRHALFPTQRHHG